MIDLGDLIDFGDLGIGPSSPRGTLGLSLVVSLTLCFTNGWLLLSSDRPLHEPAWGMGTIILGILFGSLATILSAIHLTRHDDEVGLAWASLVTGIASLLLAMATTLIA